MIERTVKIELESGLQARLAANFVQEAHRYSADVYVEKDSKKVNAKSIMGLMSLAIGSGETVTLIADGADEEIAIKHLVSFVTNES